MKLLSMVVIITVSSKSHHEVTVDNCMTGCLMMLCDASFNTLTPWMRVDGGKLLSERLFELHRRKESDCR